MKTAKVEIEVNYEDGPDGPSLVSVRVGTEPTCPILKDKPLTRRLSANLLDAAQKAPQMSSKPKPAAKAAKPAK